MVPIAPGILVYRKDREDPKAFLGGKSWLGGLPMSGETAWPHSDDGRPMRHLATIDLSEFETPPVQKVSMLRLLFDPSYKGPTCLLPKKGQIAFFADYAEGGIKGGSALFIKRPRNCTLPEGLNTSPESLSFDMPDENATEFPRWPIGFAQLPADPEPLSAELIDPMATSNDVFAPVVLEIAGTPKSYLAARNFASMFPRERLLWCWDSVYRFVPALDVSMEDVSEQIEAKLGQITILEDGIAKAPTIIADIEQKILSSAKDIKEGIVDENRVGIVQQGIELQRREVLRQKQMIANWPAAIERYKLQIARLESGWESFQSFREDVKSHLETIDPFAPLSDADYDWFQDVLRQVTTARVKKGENYVEEIGAHEAIFGCGKSRYNRNPRQIADDTFHAMVAGPPEVFDRLPEAVKTKIATEHRLPDKDRWHQILGRCQQVQDEGHHHHDKYMLLQLTSDPALGFMFGDAGNICFWITPKDLKARDFSKVTVTVEGH